MKGGGTLAAIVSFIPAGFLMAALYFVSGFVLYGIGGAVTELAGNIVQAVGGAVIGAVMLKMLPVKTLKNYLDGV